MDITMPNRRMILAIIAGSLASAVGGIVVPRLINGSPEMKIDQTLVKACHEVNRNCPMVMDA